MEQITLQIIPDVEQGGFTARIPNIPAYGQGETEAEAIAELKEAVQLFIEIEGIEGLVGAISNKDSSTKIPKYKLSDLLGQITPKNRHSEVDWGPPRANEVW